MERTKIKTIFNKIFLAALTVEILGCFISQDVNSVVARFTSLISFFVLGLLVLGNLRLREIDKELLVVVFGCIVALGNLFLIGSNKGAFLTAADVLMAFYVARDLNFEKKEKCYIGFIGAALLIWWFGNVKWYYNFNMVGMVYMMLCFLVLILLEQLKAYELKYLGVLQVVLYFVITLYCLLYHARCALLGMLIFGGLYLLMPFIKGSRALSVLLVLLSTIGSIIFTLVYMGLSKTGIEITILYKNILSGRQDIWAELWEALMKQPLTGIGSSYHLKSFFIFEVHNGMFDILAVHGIIVFAAVLMLVCKRLFEIMAVKGVEARMYLAAIYAMLFTSFFENFFINSPYLLIMIILISLCYDGNDGRMELK